MSDYVQINQAVVLLDVLTNFNTLTAALLTDRGINISIQQSYLSKYDVVDQIRVLVKDKSKAPATIKPLLDSSKTIQTIIQEGSFNQLEKYLNELPASEYEPPLPGKFKSATDVDTYGIPGNTKTDPRTTGRLVLVNPSDTFKIPQVQKWILNNGVYYGFLLYSDFALYYMGLQNIQDRIRVASDKDQELRNIVSRFVKGAGLLTQLSTTSQQVLQVKPPQPTPETTA